MGATVLIAEIVLVQVRHGNLGEDLANVCDTRVDPAQLPPSVMKRAVQDGAVATSAAVDRVFVGIGDVVVLQPLCSERVTLPLPLSSCLGCQVA